MEHPSEHSIEIYVLDESALPMAEREKIKQHLLECAYCSELHDQIREFYDDVAQRLERPLTEHDRKRAEELLSRKTLPEGTQSPSVEPVTNLKQPASSIATRLMQSVRMHPAKAAGVLGGGVVAIALLWFAIFRTPQSNPVFATIQNGMMSVYSERGGVLWQKNVAGIPDGRSYVEVDLSTQAKRFFSVSDVDGNGRNEVLLSGTSNSHFAPDSLYCFAGNGELRWAAGGGTLATFGPGGATQFSGKVIVDWTTIRQRNHNTQLFMLVRDQVYSPAKLAELDPATGKEWRAYHHRGHAAHLLVTDLRNDGNPKLVWGGINDGYNKAFIAVLDPQQIGGHAPVPSQFTPADMAQGSELYYIMFPQSAPGKASSTAPYTAVSRLRSRENGGIIVAVSDVVRAGEAAFNSSILYSFDAGMKCINSVAGDGWLEVVRRYAGISEEMARREAERIKTFKDSLLYWDGYKFVNTFAANKRSDG